MLKTPVTHPEILKALASAGHGGKVLIADGDYPVSTSKGPNAQVVYLNLAPNKMQTTEVLEALLKILCVEAATVMDVPGGMPSPSVWTDYKKMLSYVNPDIKLEPLERFAFYREVEKSDTALIIQTGETRDYANLLLTIGSLW